jgi:hypothetical protein
VIAQGRENHSRSEAGRDHGRITLKFAEENGVLIVLTSFGFMPKSFNAWHPSSPGTGKKMWGRDMLHWRYFAVAENVISTYIYNPKA